MGFFSCLPDKKDVQACCLVPLCGLCYSRGYSSIGYGLGYRGYGYSRLGGYYGKREAEAEADPYSGYGYSGLYSGLRSYGGYGYGLGYSRGYSTLGYSGLGYSRGYYGGLGYGRGYYGKREAEAEA